MNHSEEPAMANAENTNPAARLPLEMTIEYRRSYAREAERGSLKNISITGAFLCLENSHVKLEDKLVIHIAVSGRQRKITAHVVWKNAGGCGIKFLPFNNRDVQIVDDLLYFVESRRQTRRDVLDDIFGRVA
jgi:hypothetical protein